MYVREVILFNNNKKKTYLLLPLNIAIKTEGSLKVVKNLV